MREIKEQDSVLDGDYKFLIKVNSTDEVGPSDMVTMGSTYWVAGKECGSLITAYIADTLYRVPRPDEQDKEKEPEVGDKISTEECKVGWVIQHEDDDGDGDEQTVIRNKARYMETVACLYYHNNGGTPDRFFLISKGDQEILEAACGSGEPEVGDIVAFKDCKEGWIVRSDACGEYDILDQREGKTKVRNRNNHNIAWVINTYMHTIISKGKDKSPQPGDIVELRDCQVGWTVEYTKDSWHGIDNYIGHQGTIAKIGSGSSFVHYTDKQKVSKFIQDNPVTAKLISKGDEGGPLTLEKLDQAIEEAKVMAGIHSPNPYLTDSLAGMFPKKEKMSTKDFQEHMGRPGEVVEEKVVKERKMRSQRFIMTREFFNEVIQKIGGIPSDTIYNHEDLILTFLSHDFMDQEVVPEDWIRVIPDGKGGWKVEGT